MSELCLGNQLALISPLLRLGLFFNRALQSRSPNGEVHRAACGKPGTRVDGVTRQRHPCLAPCRGQPPSYFIFAGLVFTPVTVPYLRSEYGKEFEFDAPVKILDKLLHNMCVLPVTSSVNAHSDSACLIHLACGLHVY